MGRAARGAAPGPGPERSARLECRPGGSGRVPSAPCGPGPSSLVLACLSIPDSPGMAGVFPYRGPGNPVPGPLAPLPDYMSEEKLQEKGERRTGTACAGSNV